MHSNNRHTGRGEVPPRRDIQWLFFFLDSPPQADFAPSGMTEQENV
jgi:hypothetical protein